MPVSRRHVCISIYSKAWIPVIFTDPTKPGQLLKSLDELDVSSDKFHIAINSMSNCQQRAIIKDATSPNIPRANGMPQGAFAGPMFLQQL